MESTTAEQLHQTKTQQQMLDRGKEVLFASSQRIRTTDDRARLLEKGRVLLAARMSSKHNNNSLSANTTNVNVGGGDTNDDEDDDRAVLALALEQHAIDEQRIIQLEAEVALARKQLDAARSSEQLHTPLKIPSSSTATMMGEGEGSHSGQSDAALHALLQEQLIHVTQLVDERALQIRALEEKRLEAEAEALALCATISDLQEQVQQRDEQLGKAYETIDTLEASRASPTDGESASHHRHGGVGVITSPSATVSADQMLVHSLEEQVHQLSREKLEIEREAESQREIITNLQTQWNSLVTEVQKREAILTDEVHALQAKLEKTTGGTSSAAASEEDLIPKSKLEELRSHLYSEFNQHIEKYQEVNNKHWSDLVSNHQQELSAKDQRIAELEAKMTAATESTVTVPAKDVDELTKSAEELEAVRQELAEAKQTLAVERERFEAARHETDLIISAIKEDNRRHEAQQAQQQLQLDADERSVQKLRAEFQEQLDSLRADFNAEMNAKNEECESALADSTLAKDRVIASQTQLASAELLVAQLQDEVKELTALVGEVSRKNNNAGSPHQKEATDVTGEVAELAVTVPNNFDQERQLLSQRIAELEVDNAHGQQTLANATIERERIGAAHDKQLEKQHEETRAREEDLAVAQLQAIRQIDTSSRRQETEKAEWIEKISLLAKENEELQAQLAELRRQVTVVDDSAAIAAPTTPPEEVATESDATTTAASLNAAIETLQGELRVAIAARAVADEALHAAHAMHESAIVELRLELATTTERLSNDVEFYRAQVDELEKTARSQLEALELLRSEHAKEVTRLHESHHAKITALHAELQAKADEERNMRELDEDNLKHEQHSHHDEVTALRERLVKDVNAVERQYLDEIAALRNEHQDALVSLRETLEHAAVAAQQQQHARMTAEQEALLQALRLELSAKAEADTSAALEKQRDAHKATHHQVLAHLTEQLRGAQTQILQMQQERDEAVSAQLSRDQFISSSEAERASQATREIATLQHRLSGVQTQLDAARSTVTPLQEEVKKYVSVVEQLEEGLATKSRELGTARQEAIGRTEHAEHLEAQLAQCKKQLEEGRRERSTLLQQQQSLSLELENARALLTESHDNARRELDRVVAQHSKELLELEVSRAALDVQTREELQRLKEELAVSNTLLQQYQPDLSNVASTGGGNRVSDAQVQKLQSQLAEQTRQCQRLATQLQLAQDEIAEKSSIIRDQDISLSSLGEHSDAQQSLQQCTDRVAELEARVKRVTRERDGALMEKDLVVVDLTNVNRKMEGKDQTAKRLETELRAQKQQLQTQKQDNANKLRQLSDLRQEVAQLQAQLGAAQERLEDETNQKMDTLWLLQTLENSVALYEQKMFATWALLTEELLINGYALPFMNAVASFSDRNAKLLKRCDDIDSLAQEALEDGLRQNRDLRDQCRAQQQRIKLIEDSYNEGEKRREELEDAYHKTVAECKRLAEELQSVRAQAATDESALQREVVALKSTVAQTNARNERLTGEATAARETFELELRSADESSTTLKATLKLRSEQLHALERDSTATIESLTQQLHDTRRELGEVQRLLKLSKTQSDDMSARLAVSEPAAMQLSEEVSELKSTVLRLTKQREHEGHSLRRSLEALEEQVRALNATLEQTKLESDGLVQERVKLVASLQQSNDEGARIRERLTNSELALSEATATLEEEREAWYRERRAAEQRHTVLQATSRSSTTERDDAVAELNRLRMALEELEKAKKSVDSDHMITVADLNELQQTHKRKLFELEHTSTRLENETNELRGELERSRMLVEQLKDDKAKLRSQSEVSEQHLRDANSLNVVAHREVQALQHQLTEQSERTDREISQLRTDLATAKKVAASSDARARDAERTCEALSHEKRQIQEEFERTRTSLVGDVQAAQLEKQESHTRATDLHRQGVALEAELSHARRQTVEVQAQLGSCQQELSEYRALVHTASERARAAVAEREELSGQLTALRDESRRQKLQLERKVKECEDTLHDRVAELEALQARVQQGSHVLRSSEMGLQQHITDLTVAQHQLKHELSTLTANHDALKSSLEHERAQAKKAIADAAVARQRLAEVEQEYAAKLQSREDAIAKQQLVVQQLSEDLESIRAHSSDDKKSALASLERVIQADRQALSEVRQARERALRACDQAQREKVDLESDIERLTNTVRVARLEAEGARQELQSVVAIAEQAAAELSSMDELFALSSASPLRSAAGGATTAADSHFSTSSASPHRGGEPHSQHRTAATATTTTTTTRPAAAGGAANYVSWFGNIIDKLLGHLSAVRTGINVVALERQQLRETQTELDVHERAIQDAAATIESVQVTLRQLSDRVELGRSSGNVPYQQQQQRSGSRMSDDGYHHQFGSRDSSHDRNGVTTPRMGAAGGVQHNSNNNNAAAVQHTRLQRFALTRLVQQSLLLEKCLQTASVTQESMRAHIHTAGEHVATLERAAISSAAASSHHHHNHQRSGSTSAGGGRNSNSNSHYLVSASTALEMYADEPTHVSDAIRNRCVVLGSGLVVISTRVAQQTRMLMSLQQQLREFQAAVTNPQISLEALLLSGGNNNNNSSSASAPPYPLIRNPREFALVFSQAESWSSLSFLALSSMAPITMNTAADASDATYAASQQHHQQGAGGAANRPARPPAATAAATRHHDDDIEDIDDDRDDAHYNVRGGIAGGHNSHNQHSSSDHDDDDDAAGGAGGEEAKLQNTRAFQKMRKENKRLYFLVRNLTEKLKVASTQAAVGSRAASTTSAVGGSVAVLHHHQQHHVSPSRTTTTSQHYGGAHVDPTTVAPFISPIRRTLDDDDEHDGLDDDDDDVDEEHVVMRNANNNGDNNDSDDEEAGDDDNDAASTVVAMSPDPAAAAFSSPEGDVRWVPR
ncbi:Hypothetical protein, putative [Bodo saltans]|uniref:Uncharacterized protein n=1 Tax=Bodo saltans TaxID=75058 RepID=A0A0S4JU03_BODSA|nr:Hypothetical protein, putative [Bodo saltans]|eukprot:CUG93717.1 Hypothetical protein, putative [Bodo saltans]